MPRKLCLHLEALYIVQRLATANQVWLYGAAWTPRVFPVPTPAQLHMGSRMYSNAWPPLCGCGCAATPGPHGFLRIPDRLPPQQRRAGVRVCCSAPLQHHDSCQ